ncbi:putative Ulp1 peptidase [Rosa chinensis]|uniref:Putative Ulp1 peptidase n=1 Tax=Rosa chinensis TaxID=74649 RepID=A0A2P6R4V8_ROSCH|nr:putative Ulp1 peptidase [Rosa chinensis]
MDPKVLTYESVVLRMSDLALLRGPHYLNDCIIEFYFNYLSSLCDDDILLVSPTVSFWLANSQNSEANFRDFEESNQLGEKQVVIFTVNDNQDMSQNDGGNHWSLLVYYRKSNAFVHYDSLGGLNSLVARKFYGAVKKYVAAAATQTPTFGTSSLVATTRSIIGKHYSKHLRIRDHHHKKKQEKKNVSGAFVMMGRTFSNKFHQFRNYHKKKNILGGVRGYSLHKKCLRHYTNYHPTKNTRTRDTTWKKVWHALQNYLVNNNGDDEETGTSDKDDDNDPWFREENVMPQQTNLYDCGLYVISVARVICHWYYDEEEQQQQNCCFLGDDRFPNIMKHLDNSIEYAMRPQLLRLIQRLKREN